MCTGDAQKIKICSGGCRGFRGPVNPPCFGLTGLFLAPFEEATKLSILL